MKYPIFVAFLLLSLTSCITQKNAAASWSDYTITSECPEDSSCKLELLEGKSLLVKSDDTGHLYYNLEDAPGKTVVQYTYRTITDAALADAGYSETIVFETDGKPFKYKDADMQKAKMLFNVQCFCRGKAGIRKIEHGTATYDGKNLHMEIPGLVDDQKTKLVNISFN